MITNLCFHGIGTCTVEREPGEASYWISTSLFLDVLDLVVERPDVRLSFDDGNVSDVATALPALAERGLHASFFALAGRLADRSSLSAADLRELSSAGMDIGSHGWRHVPWRRLGAQDLRREVHEARSELEGAAGVRIAAAALPLGRYDRAALRAVRQAGYQHLYSSDRFRARPSWWFQARHSVMATDTLESIRAVLDGPALRVEARNVAASMVKRIL